MTWTLYNADCIEAMRAMPDKAYDLAIVDPPYGLGKRLSGGTNHKNGFNAHHWQKMRDGWDSTPPNAEYFNELFRVSQNQIIWGANYYPQHLTPSMGWVFWFKGQENFSFSDGEFAFTSFDCKARIVNISRGSEITAMGGGTIHPTQKPVALYKWLLKNYAKPNDRILDTHGGSCSSVIAAIDMGFSIDAYELDPDYYAMALKRIQTHELQPRLIPNTPPTTEQTTLL